MTSLAKSINQVLTDAYLDVYGSEDGDVTLELITAPLAATEEVLALFQAGLAPVEVAVPACLHAIGASKQEIDEAVKKAMADKDRVLNNEQTTANHDATSREKEHNAKDQEHAANEQRLVVEIAGAKAAVEKTKAETESIRKGDKDDGPPKKKAKASSSS